MNQLEDREITDALYRASQAGVHIDCIVRGFCCLRAGVPGLSENIRVSSIIGRVLEHSRIFWFGGGREDPLDGDFFIGSADLMPRNLDRRVELLIPVLDEDCRQRVIELLELCLADNVKARCILPDGGYEAVRRTSPPVRCQEEAQRLSTEAAEIAVKRERMMFTPQAPQ